MDLEGYELGKEATWVRLCYMRGEKRRAHIMHSFVSRIPLVEKQQLCMPSKSQVIQQALSRKPQMPFDV